MGKSRAKDNTEHEHGDITRFNVIVRCVSAPDAEIRIDRAIIILLAAAAEAAMRSNEITNPEEDSPCETHTNDTRE